MLFSGFIEEHPTPNTGYYSKTHANQMGFIQFMLTEYINSLRVAKTKKYSMSDFHIVVGMVWGKWSPKGMKNPYKKDAK